MNVKQKVFRLGLVSVLAVGMGAVVAAPGGAAAPATKCAHLKGSATLTPGLSSAAKNQTVVAKGNLTTCAPTKATGGSGTLSATIKLSKGSCAGLLGGGQKLSGSAKSVWKNKKTSTYALIFTTGTGKQVTTATITGKVSAGLFKGKKVSAQIKIAPKAGQDCVTHPVKNITFTNTKPFQIL
jgi:hypothetical protein